MWRNCVIEWSQISWLKISWLSCLNAITSINDILPKNARVTITWLCLICNDTCNEVIETRNLDELEHEVAIILCQLYMIFHPSFFDIMLHLIVHLVRDNRVYGPIYLQWIYLIQWYTNIFKGYTKNHDSPEASIVELYIIEEAIEFCTNYLSEANSIGIPESHHDGRYDGICIHGLNLKTFDRDIVLQAHFHILNNLSENQPYMTI